MNVTIDRDEIYRQLSEIKESEHAHRGDMRRRRAVQGLAAVGLLSAAAREAYRREVLPSLPAARFLLESEREQVTDADRRAGAALLDAYRWQTTMQPALDSLHGSAAVTSSHAAAIALSAAGGERRAQERPWLSIASAGFSAIRALAVGRQVLEDMQDGHLDVFTTLNAVASIAAVPLTVPEAVRAMRGLLAR